MTETIEQEAAPLDLPELAHVEGFEVGNEKAATFAQQMAALTMVLRTMKAIQKGLDAQDEAYRLEVEALTGMHQQQTAYERDRLASFRRYALNLAELMDWPKSKKSNSTPYGTVGVRDTKASVELVDAVALEDWVVNNRPEFIATETYVKWKELKATLDPEQPLPDGVAVVPAARTPYAKIA